MVTFEGESFAVAGLTVRFFSRRILNLANSFLREGFGLRLIQPPFGIRAQSIANILVHDRQVEPFRIKVAAAPPNGFGVFRILSVGDGLQEPLIS
jgi:hypothetical protein